MDQCAIILVLFFSGVALKPKYNNQKAFNKRQSITDVKDVGNVQPGSVGEKQNSSTPFQVCA